MQPNSGFVFSVAAVLFLALPGSFGNLRARAFYALTNHPNGGEIVNMAPPAMEAVGLDEATEPLVFLQNAGNDPRWVSSRNTQVSRISNYFALSDASFAALVLESECPLKSETPPSPGGLDEGRVSPPQHFRGPSRFSQFNSSLPKMFPTCTFLNLNC